MILLNSSLPKGICYVETKNLDGETNLKHKKALADSVSLAVNDAEVLEHFNESKIECDKPNEYIYKFNGVFNLDEESLPLDEEQILLRGSSLRNTEWVYGVAVYTGHQTKIMMNSS